MNELDDEPGTIRCSACHRVTSGGKPYCSRHVLRMPYAADLRAGLRARPRFVRPSRWVLDEELFRVRARA